MFYPKHAEAVDDTTKTEQSGEEIPPEIANVDEIEDDDDDDDDDVVDLRAFGVVGPVIFLELLELPPQPKHIKNWTIQQSMFLTILSFFSYYVRNVSILIVTIRCLIQMF